MQYNLNESYVTTLYILIFKHILGLVELPLTFYGRLLRSNDSNLFGFNRSLLRCLLQWVFVFLVLLILSFLCMFENSPALPDMKLSLIVITKFLEVPINLLMSSHHNACGARIYYSVVPWRGQGVGGLMASIRSWNCTDC